MTFILGLRNVTGCSGTLQGSLSKNMGTGSNGHKVGMTDGKSKSLVPSKKDGVWKTSRSGRRENFSLSGHLKSNSYRFFRTSEEVESYLLKEKWKTQR